MDQREQGFDGDVFGLWSLGVYIDTVRETQKNKSYRLYGWATFLFVAALLGKPWAVAIPVMAAIVDFCFLRQPIISILKRVVPWVVIAVGIIFITQRVQSSADLMAIEIIKRPFVATDAIIFYIKRFSCLIHCSSTIPEVQGQS